MEDMNVMYKCITHVHSREMLLTMSCNDYPHAKKGSREKLHKAIYKNAFPDLWEKKPIISMENLADILSKG